ncbi:MAG TPA: methyltransferase domain-containing protein [Spirochaetota bacterium]|nr:methyltransferase domain-containing protein [Spirochaetota bacterium]
MKRLERKQRGPSGFFASIDKRKSHEEKVERFYSHGSRRRARVADGFLSFGYWERDTRDYHASAENLVRYFIRESNIVNPSAILNVACGNGAESLRFYESFKPGKMCCIDITADHIENAREKVAGRNDLAGISFEKRDAANTGYPDAAFSHVIGIEGPAHFNTRRKFFAECHRVLRGRGELVLTDIILNAQNARQRFFLPWLTRFISKHWHMPEENRVRISEYREHLEEAGFGEISITPIGDRVFNGFAKNNIRLSSIARAVRVRGPVAGLGLAALSWFLGYGYRMGIIDYIFVRARKGA